jgi:S-adenosylmethionine hydrolase
MASPLVTLTTDFGAGSPYVGALKGAVLSVNPAASLVDLSHDVPPQDLRFCSFLLCAACPYFPSSALHVVVVDPGVGSERTILYVQTGDLRLLVPDNGCWTALAKRYPAPPFVVRLQERRYWRASVSSTFHGRDIFAPVAGYLTLGLAPELLGPHIASWAELHLPEPQISSGVLEGEVVFVDDFGNLLTNIGGDTYRRIEGSVRSISVNGQQVNQRVLTYADAPTGTLVALISSVNTLELAVVQGNAAHKLGASTGTPVRVACDA